MSEEFERELAEDWDEAADQLDGEDEPDLPLNISVGVSDAMEFDEE